MTKRHQRKYKKWISAVGIILEVAIAVILLIAVGYLSKKMEVAEETEQIVEKEESIFEYTDRVKEIGELHTLEKIEENYMYGIQYPVLGNETIDQNISSKVKEMIDLFILDKADYQAATQDEKAVLIVDYESYAINNKIVSIVFYLTKSDNTGLPSGSIKTHVYNLEKGSSLTLQDVFSKDFEEQVSVCVTNYFSTQETLKPYIDTVQLKYSTSPLPGNFSSFSLADESVTFYFGSGVLCPRELGVQKAVIPRSELESVLLIDNSGTSKVTEATTIQEQPENSAEVTETPAETTEPPATEPTPSASIETEPQVTLEIPTPSVELDLDRPMIAFTFDDGPYTPVTGRILDVLEANNSKATFFVMGNRVNSYKEVLTRAYGMGCQIGNHSFNHKAFNAIPADDVYWQIAYTNDLVEAIIGVRTTIVRVPYGAYQGEVSLLVKYPMIQWNIDPQDWKLKDKNAIVENVMRNVSDGSIILMHDLYPTTADAFEELVPLLIAEGYQLVTINDLYAAKGVPLEPGKVYFNIK